MSYYIDSHIGKIFFHINKKSPVLISQNNSLIKRLNITFYDDVKFFQLSDFYDWIFMDIIIMNNQYYLYIHLNDHTYETLNIYYDHNEIKIKNY